MFMPDATRILFSESLLTFFKKKKKGGGSFIFFSAYLFWLQLLYLASRRTFLNLYFLLPTCETGERMSSLSFCPYL